VGKWTREQIEAISEKLINLVKSAIKEDEEMRDGASANYDDRFFKVLHTPIDEYEYSIV
jgi:hypothetical protein